MSDMTNDELCVVLVNSQQLSCEMIAQNGLVDVVFELEDALSRAAAIVTKGTNP